MHIPPFSHAVDLQTHVYAGFLYSESEPLQAVQTDELVHSVQLLLQAKFNKKYFYFMMINK